MAWYFSFWLLGMSTLGVLSLWTKVPYCEKSKSCAGACVGSPADLPHGLSALWVCHLGCPARLRFQMTTAPAEPRENQPAELSDSSQLWRLIIKYWLKPVSFGVLVEQQCLRGTLLKMPMWKLILDYHCTLLPTTLSLILKSGVFFFLVEDHDSWADRKVILVGCKKVNQIA